MRKHRQTLLIGLLVIFLAACTQSELTPGIQATFPMQNITVTQDPTPTLTPTPFPTPTPQELVNEGEMALFVGDYDVAYQIFSDALTQSSDEKSAAQSRLGLGQAFLMQENYGLALIHLRDAAEADEATIAARAQYLLGQCYTQLNRYEEALGAYEAYLELRPGVIDSHVYELRGDIYNTLNDPTQAIENFQQSYRTHPDGGEEQIEIKIARAYQAEGNLETALSMYKDIYNNSTNDYTKAQMDLLIGRIYEADGDMEQASTNYQDTVTNSPFAFDAFTALTALENAGIAVNEYQRGLVHYYRNNHNLAIKAFDLYIGETPTDFADSALYFKALSTRAIGDNEGAIALWQSLIENYPTSGFYVDAWEDIEFTFWAYMGQPESAAESAISFANRFPDASETPSFLFLAGRSYERAGLLTEAVETWLRLPDNYPESDQTFSGIFFAGIAKVRMGDWAGAQPLFARASLLASEPAQVAAAHLWIGKCQEALGDISAALDSWKQAQIADPFGHYSIRAEDLLIEREVFSPPDDFNLDPNLTPYLLEAEAWLRDTFALPADINLESPGLLANDPRFQRGIEFWALGDYRAGKNEFESMRLAFANDPAQTFRLIPALVEIGLYRSALVASTNLLQLANLEGADALTAPEFFSRVRFGAYFLDWVLPIAESEGISPLLLLSVMRQESTYEGFISSSAGARGLMQIMPSTGEQLAQDLEWPENYTTDDLYRPYVSLLFGANYLKKQRNLFEGDLFAMLAAYNGGPGNTIAWKDLTPIDDPDLLLEVIRIQETRNYIRLINEIFYIYRWLYGGSTTP
jgi:soluble lytic murein transglycosylase